ncbi:MAG: HD-GYP domain-containing protein [bacterium]|nr:HD-GYP domain-containing protein [bacterium]
MEMTMGGTLSKKNIFVILRWLITFIIILIFIQNDKFIFDSVYILSFIFLYVSSNFILNYFGDKIFENSWLNYTIFIIDIIFISAAIYYNGEIDSNFYLVYFLTILMATIGQDIKMTFIISSLSCLIYIYIIYRTTGSFNKIIDPAFFIRLPFFYIISLTSSFQSQEFREKELKMTAQQHEDFINTVDALGKLIEFKDPYTGGKHCHTVRKYAVAIAVKLNLPQEQIENVRIAASLHDIGKIGVKGSILNKEGPLDDLEIEMIKKHPMIGEEAIKSIDKLKYVRKIIRYHHERFDGNLKGSYGSYTGEVKGEEIPIEARIISVADSYDAMTSDRPYRKALVKEDAKKIIEAESGKQFDPKITKVFLELLEEIDC